LNSCVQDLDIQPIDPSTVQTFNEPEVFAKVYAAWALTGQQGAAGNNDIDIDDEGRFSLYRTLWVTQELPTDEAICAWGDIEVVTLNRSSFYFNKSRSKRTLCPFILRSDYCEPLSDANRWK